MTSGLQLTTTLERRGPAAAIVLTDEQVTGLGGGRTPPVRITIGSVTVEGRVGRMGGENLVGLSKERRAALGVEAGDTVEVQIALDGGDRAVEVPADLAEALAAAGVREAFDALAPSHRKEHVRSVTDAKKAETRARRVSAVVTTLSG